MGHTLNEIPINNIQHIGIPVTDILVSEGFYKRLGFSNVMQAGFLHVKMNPDLYHDEKRKT